MGRTGETEQILTGRGKNILSEISPRSPLHRSYSTQNLISSKSIGDLDFIPKAKKGAPPSPWTSVSMKGGICLSTVETAPASPPAIKEELSTLVNTYHYRYKDPTAFEKKHSSVIQKNHKAFHRTKGECQNYLIKSCELDRAFPWKIGDERRSLGMPPKRYLVDTLSMDPIDIDLYSIARTVDHSSARSLRTRHIKSRQKRSFSPSNPNSRSSAMSVTASSLDGWDEFSSMSSLNSLASPVTTNKQLSKQRDKNTFDKYSTKATNSASLSARSDQEEVQNQIQQFEARLASDEILRSHSKKDLRVLTTASTRAKNLDWTVVPSLAIIAKDVPTPSIADLMTESKTGLREELVDGLRSLRNQPMARVDSVNLDFCMCTICVYSLSKGAVEILVFEIPSSLDNKSTADKERVTGQDNEIARLILTKDKFKIWVVPPPPKRSAPSIPDPSINKDILLLPSEVAELKKRFQQEKMEISQKWDQWLKETIPRFYLRPWEDKNSPRFDLLMHPVKVERNSGASWRLICDDEESNHNESGILQPPDPNKVTFYFNDT